MLLQQGVRQTIVPGALIFVSPTQIQSFSDPTIRGLTHLCWHHSTLIRSGWDSVYTHEFSTQCRSGLKFKIQNQFRNRTRTKIHNRFRNQIRTANRFLLKMHLVEKRKFSSDMKLHSGSKLAAVSQKYLYHGSESVAPSTIRISTASPSSV